jgi:hypothetical protein
MMMNEQNELIKRPVYQADWQPNKPEVILWIPVEHDLPDEEMLVIYATNFDGGEVYAGYRLEGQWYTIHGTTETGRVTHWADFPKHPNEAGG